MVIQKTAALYGLLVRVYVSLLSCLLIDTSLSAYCEQNIPQCC